MVGLYVLPKSISLGVGSWPECRLLKVKITWTLAKLTKAPALCQPIGDHLSTEQPFRAGPKAGEVGPNS